MFKIINAKEFTIGRYSIAIWIEPALNDGFVWWSDYSVAYISIGYFSFEIHKMKVST